MLLKNNQDKHRQIVAEISREKEELLAECQQLEERVAALLAEIEKAKIVTKRKEDAAEQLHLQIKNLSFEKEALQTNLKVAEETIVAFKAN